jgi:hypothetical protein
MKARAIAGLVVIALAGWALAAIFVAPEKKAAPTQFASSRQCAQCHAQVFAEWESSWHAQSWTDVEVRKLSSDFSNTDCIDCHAPLPVFETGVTNRVLPRFVRQVEGVDCIACHMRPDDRVAGTIDDPRPACRPVAERDLLKPEYCGGCHNQHGTVDQWKASRFAVAGDGFKDCVACHMPVRDPSSADPRKGGRVHTMLGGHDLELVKSAITFNAMRVDGRPVVAIENVGAGHNFPTDERSRAADLFWRPAGETTWHHVYRFRNPYRYEVGLPNTELPSGQKISVTIDDEKARDPIEVALFFKTTPYYTIKDQPDPEKEARLLFSAKLE